MDLADWHERNKHSEFIRQMREQTYIKVDKIEVDPLEVQYECGRDGEAHSMEISITILQLESHLTNCGISRDTLPLSAWAEREANLESGWLPLHVLRIIHNTMDTRPKRVKKRFFGGSKVLPPDPIEPKWFWTATNRVVEKEDRLVFVCICVPGTAQG